MDTRIDGLKHGETVLVQHNGLKHTKTMDYFVNKYLIVM